MPPSWDYIKFGEDCVIMRLNSNFLEENKVQYLSVEKVQNKN